MGISTFQANVLVNIEGKSYILLRKLDEGIWQLEETKTRRVVEYTDDQLRKMYSTGKLYFIKEALHSLGDVSVGIAHQAVSAEQFDTAKIRRAYVLAIRGLPNTEVATRTAIDEIWKKLQLPPRCPHWITVYRWKCRYQKSGGDIHAIVNQALRKGNRTPRYPQEVIDIANQAIDTVFLTRERKTIEDTIEKAQLTVDRENKLRPVPLQLSRPTRRLIASLIAKIPAFDRAVAREGRLAAIKRFRSVQAHRTTEAPLQRAEIDHTQLDIFAIDDATGLPLGRPWITVCIDDYSRCILGIFISFEPPSYFTVAQCLKDAFTPKHWLRDIYPEIRNHWEAHGVMRELVVDNGMEFHSQALELACFSLGIEIHYSARKTPWFKGKIERFLGTLNRAIAHGHPGTTFSNIFEKDDYDPSKHAVVRLSTLKQIVRLWIADYYHQKPHRTLQQPPAVMWNSSISQEEIFLPDSMDQLDAILGRPEKRILSHRGIDIEGLRYNSPELTQLRMKTGDTVPIEARVNDSNLGSIIVLTTDNKRMFIVPALNQKYANGLTRWQHRVCKRCAANELKKYDPESWLEAKEAISHLIQEEFMLKKQRSRAKMKRFITQGYELEEHRSKTQQEAGKKPERQPNTPISPMLTEFKRFSPVISPRIQHLPDFLAREDGHEQ